MDVYLNEITGIADAICSIKILEPPFLTRNDELTIRNTVKPSFDADNLLINTSSASKNMIKAFINECIPDPRYLDFITLSFTIYDENDKEKPVGLQHMSLLEFSYYYYKQDDPDFTDNDRNILNNIAEQFSKKMSEIIDTELLYLLGKNSETVIEKNEKLRVKRSGIEIENG